MGTIAARTKKDGSTTFTATVRVKQGGRVVLSKSATFDRQAAANAWIAKTEKDAAKPGGLTPRAPTMTLGQAIDKYMSISRREIGRTKLQCLEATKTDEIADMPCDQIVSSDIVSYAQRLQPGRQPQTVMSYMSHLGAVFSLAAGAFGAPLSEVEMKRALKACMSLGLIAKSTERTRRPTIDELDRLLSYFNVRSAKRVTTAPMDLIMVFAIFSARRREEITRMRWDDITPGKVMVRDMKHPGQTIGNDVLCDLVPEAEEVLRAVPRRGDLVFPHSTAAITTAFQRACKALKIDDLHFHDLRHEGASRLLEMGWTIPQAASVTGHRSWASLQRYSQLRQTGDKLAEWKWRKALSIGQKIPLRSG